MRRAPASARSLLRQRLARKGVFVEVRVELDLEESVAADQLAALAREARADLQPGLLVEPQGGLQHAAVFRFGVADALQFPARPAAVRRGGVLAVEDHL